MLTFLLGLVLFFLVHLVPTQTDLRRGLVDRFGSGGYKAVISVVSLIGLVLIVVGFGDLQTMPGKNPELWVPPVWTRHIAFLLMLPAMILFVAAEVPSRIRSAVKHPMLAGIKVWAAAHLLANGDLASVLLFGSFLGYAVYDRISVKQRMVAARPGPQSGGLRNDFLVVALGVGLYAFMLLVGHALLIRVPLLPGWY